MTGAALFAEIRAYLLATGCSATQFGVQAMGNPSFVTSLRSTASPRPATIERVQRWIAENPDGPADMLVPRAQAIVLPRDVRDMLQPHAVRRKLTVGQLAALIVMTVVDDDLIGAVLDDGEEGA